MKDLKYAIVVAGGSGLRMGTELPKQFLLLSGMPVLMHTILRFYHTDPETELILVLPSQHFKYWKNLCLEYNFDIPHTLVEGGKTRFESVKRGLLSIQGETGVVAIHDGVRPLVSTTIIRTSYEVASIKGNAIAAVKLKDSIRVVDADMDSKALDRNLYYLIQTPQTFILSHIKNAFAVEESPDFTDDATVLEKTGTSIHLIPGDYKNIKITTPEDLIIAGALLQSV